MCSARATKLARAKRPISSPSRPRTALSPLAFTPLSVLTRAPSKARSKLRRFSRENTHTHTHTIHTQARQESELCGYATTSCALCPFVSPFRCGPGRPSNKGPVFGPTQLTVPRSHSDGASPSSSKNNSRSPIRGKFKLWGCKRDLWRPYDGKSTAGPRGKTSCLILPNKKKKKKRTIPPDQDCGGTPDVLNWSYGTPTLTTASLHRLAELLAPR